jgi:hypothetical protein
MPLRHTVIRRIFPVSGIGLNVVGTQRSPTPEGLFENCSVARHGKFCERFSWCARKRVERVRFPGVPFDIVEERTELGMAELDARVGDHLDQLFEVKLRRDRHPGPVEQLQSTCFLAHLTDARFQCFIHGKKARFERLSLGNFEERSTKKGGRFADRQLALAGDPAQPPVRMFDPELYIEGASSTCCPERLVDLWGVVDEDRGLPT